MKTIEIIVSSTGQTQVETKGFAGSECRDASRFLEEALGALGHELSELAGSDTDRVVNFWIAQGDQ